MRLARDIVFFINPPNSNDVFPEFSDASAVTKGVQHTDWANFPHLGILSLASFIDATPELKGRYIDGVVHPFQTIINTLSDAASDTLAVCLSAITANYESAIRIAEAVRRIDPDIAIVMGNDHFTAMNDKILSRHRELIDCGFAGNEVYSSLSRYLIDRQKTCAIDIYPGSVRWENDRIIRDPIIRESVNQIVDYGLIDRTLPHTDTYTQNFNRRLGQRIFELTGRRVTRGVPIEIGRGCIKFSGDDACSFCSIQYGGMWKNELPAEHAWRVIHQACEAGYDYLYVTADELPLTFSRLLLDMAESPPPWWQSLQPEERPVLVGYARTDGMEKEHVLRAMRQIGFRILFVGVDAGAARSLMALNKPLRSKDPESAAGRMHQANLRALDNARQHGVAIKAGFVLGHLGMNEALLEENIATYADFLKTGHDVIISADIELLSPEPGSKDFHYLTHPDAAEAVSARLGLPISSGALRRRIAERYRQVDTFDREEAIDDYIRAFMPGVSKARIAAARDRVRSECRQLGIVVGDDF